MRLRSFLTRALHRLAFRSGRRGEPAELAGSIEAFDSDREDLTPREGHRSREDAIATTNLAPRQIQDRPSLPLKSDLTIGAVDLGDLRRLDPVSRDFGFDRGQPIDRYYIERFLKVRSGAIRGRVLEIGEPLYTRMFGAGRVTESEILDVMGNPDATYTCRLEEGDELPADAFDCVIVTQTLQYIYDFRAALRSLHRITKPGGAVLATVPGIISACRDEYEDVRRYWSFTAASIIELFSELFERDAVDVEVFGNVLAATGFLYGLAESELDREELDHLDLDYEVIIGVQAVK